MDLVSTDAQDLTKSNCERTLEPTGFTESASVDSRETEIVTNFSASSSGSYRRRSIRRRSIKPTSRSEPGYGYDTETYEKIRERILQERAVTNAIDALQERFKMINFLYSKCLERNMQRKEMKIKKLSVKRQYELIVMIFVFVLICLPISIFFIVLIHR